jgi:hypothetical protein
VVAIHPPISNSPPKLRVGLSERCTDCYPLALLGETFRKRQRRSRADNVLGKVSADRGAAWYIQAFISHPARLRCCRSPALFAVPFRRKLPSPGNSYRFPCHHPTERRGSTRVPLKRGAISRNRFVQARHPAKPLHPRAASGKPEVGLEYMSSRAVSAHAGPVSGGGRGQSRILSTNLPNFIELRQNGRELLVRTPHSVCRSENSFAIKCFLHTSVRSRTTAN